MVRARLEADVDGSGEQPARKHVTHSEQRGREYRASCSCGYVSEWFRVPRRVNLLVLAHKRAHVEP